MPPAMSPTMSVNAESSSRVLKKPANSILDIREAYLVKRRSFQDSDASRFTNDEDGLFEHPATIHMTSGPDGRFQRSFVHQQSCSAAC
jgi:hypothetical protein